MYLLKIYEDRSCLHKLKLGDWLRMSDGIINKKIKYNIK